MAKNGIDWDKIRAEYVAGTESCRQIAERWNISPNIVSKKATKDGWKNDRRKCGEKTAERIISRSARAREEAALKGLDLVKYTMDVWNDNLRTLNETIKKTPAYMLANPSFASGIAKGLQTTYDLLLRMSGEGEKQNREKLELERQKLQLEREKLEAEKKRLELELRSMEAAGDTGVSWEIVADEPEAKDGRK